MSDIRQASGVQTHILFHLLELLPCQTEFLEDSIPYFGPEQILQNLNRDRKWEKLELFWVTWLYKHFEIPI